MPAALEARGCFPAFDHGLSTNAGFEEHCICMTRLHEICGSANLDLGEFPRRTCPLGSESPGSRSGD